MRRHLLLLLFLFTSLIGFGQQVTQVIRGVVKDKESGATITGTVLMVYSDSILIKGTTSDESGAFKLEEIPVGRKTVIAKFIGYNDVVLPVILSSAKELVLNIEMEESLATLGTVEVEGIKQGDISNEYAVISARQFSVEETDRYAGSRGDPARMASNFAGVQGGDDSRNDIIVRGNSPSGVLWRLEGVDIPNPNHFAVAGSSGGPVSILNNKILANSDFFTGAFPAEFGNSISGVFDIKLRNGNNQKHEFTAQLGFLGTEIMAEGPLSKKTGSSYLVNYRYSTVSMFSALGINIGTYAVPKYQDGSFKLNFPLKKGGVLSVFGVGGYSDIDILISNQKDTSQVDLYSQNDRDQYFTTSMAVLGAVYSKSLNEKTFIKSTTSYSYENQKALHEYIDRTIDNEGNFNVKDIFPILDYSFIQNKISNHTYINTKLNKNHVLKAGINATYFMFDFADSTLLISTPPLTKIGWATRWDYNGTALMLQPYVQWKFRANEKTTIVAGWHGQYFSRGNALSVVEPRVGFRYQVTPKQSFNFGAGIHSQAQPVYTYFYSLPQNEGALHNTNMDFSKSLHLVAGYDIALPGNLRLKPEVYYQSLWNIPVELRSSSYSMINQGTGFSRFFPDTLTNNGTGTNYGIELTLEKYFSKQFFFLITGSLYESKYKGSDGVERNTSFNGNYAVNLLGGYEKNIFKHTTLGFGTKVTMAGGKRYGLVDTLASAAQQEVVFLDNRFNEFQFRNYFRLDFKVNLKFNRPKVTHELAVDFVNILNTRNILSITYAPVPGDSNAIPFRENYQLGFLPIFYYKLDF